jgi:hypothetical protein
MGSKHRKKEVRTLIIIGSKSQEAKSSKQAIYTKVQVTGGVYQSEKEACYLLNSASAAFFPRPEYGPQSVRPQFNN